MKKVLSAVLVFLVLLGCSTAMAEMGVQIIGGQVTETESVSLDDFKLNAEVKIDGWGKIKGTSCEYQDVIVHNGGWDSYRSGAEAEYLVLRMDIVNTTTTPRDYLISCDVKVVYDDLFEYAGWCYQYDFDRSENYVLDKEENFAIDPMYAGHYCFGCTLPNAVVEGKEPLRMIITIDGNEITYNVRK